MRTGIANNTERKTVGRPTISKLWALRLALLLATTGCQTVQAPEEQATPEAMAEEPAEVALVEGWACNTPESCFGLKVGHTRTFERHVGKSVGQESWTLTEVSTEGLVTTFAQEGGPEAYQVDSTGLSMSYGGELLSAVRFPVRFGNDFEVTNQKGSRVTMHVERTEGVLETPAGDFADCILHEARFANPEQPDSDEMVVRTTLCEGVGEVHKRIQLPSMPNPIVFTLLAKEQV